jgi:serine/threonine protein kinase
VTELAPFGSLKSVLDRSANEKRALPFAYLRHVCSDAASGLRFLHTSTIVHRDIKPANLLVFSLSSSETVVAKLTDFGSARVAKGNLMTANKAGIMQMASNDRSGLEGTPIYMAPELFAGSARPSEATDVHALGMTFYETTSFVEPYTEIAFPWDIAKAVVAGKRPEWPAERRVPDWFAALVRRMWAPDAATRPVVQDVLLELDAHDADADSDSDGDKRSSVDDIVRKLSLRERQRSENEDENDEEENDFESFQSE